MLNLYNRPSSPLFPLKVKLAKTKNSVIFVLVICILAVERNGLQKIATAGVAEKKGHFYKACRSSSKSLTAGIHDEKDDQISSGDDSVVASLSPCLFSLTGVSISLALFTIPVQINKKTIYALLNSGASLSHQFKRG